MRLQRLVAHAILAVGMVRCSDPAPMVVPMDASRDAPAADDAAPDLAIAPDASPTDAPDASHAPDVSDAPDGSDAPRPPLVWRPCYGTFYCTDVSVPLDYARPAGPRVTVGVLRARARTPSARVGVLMLNHGGPGSTTTTRVVQDYPNVLGSVVGATVADTFDIVAVDWRGHGRSTPSLRCGFVRDSSPTATALDVDPVSDTSWNAAVTAYRELQRGCVDGVGAAFLASVGSDTMARDMDAVREALGESRITYVGYSYGAWLGAVYLTLFPSRARAVVLDSPPQPDRDLRTLTRVHADGFQRAFERFFAWCAADTRCPMTGRTEGAAGVSRAFDALVAEMDAAPLTVGLRRVTGDAAISAINAAAYAPEFLWVRAAEVLAEAQRGNASPLVRMLDAYADGDNFRTSYYAVRALDNAPDARETSDSFRAFLRADIATIGRYMPRVSASNVAFVGWPVRRTTPLPAISAPTAPRALVVSARGDAPTPYAGALRTHEALGNSSYLLTYEGAMHASSTIVPCVGGVVRDYLSDPSAEPSTTTCPALAP